MKLMFSKTVHQKGEVKVNFTLEFTKFMYSQCSRGIFTTLFAFWSTFRLKPIPDRTNMVTVKWN